MPTPDFDVELLKALAEQPSVDVVTRLLLEGPLRQRDLVSDPGLSAVTVSRTLHALEKSGVVRTFGKRAPYEVVFPEKTEQILQAVADLADFILTDKKAAVTDRSKALRKASMERSATATARDETG
jgi:DNA-binding HxlR family transcriptional regulator